MHFWQQSLSHSNPIAERFKRLSHYTTFGSPMPMRSWSDPNAKYKYGFNGKELDKGDEGMGGGGSTYDYGFRIYNTNLGRFLSIDPLTESYPWYTPYQFAGNKPIQCIDLDGLEEFYTNGALLDRNQPHIKIEYYTSIDASGNIKYFKRFHYYNIRYIPTTQQTQAEEINKDEYHHAKKWILLGNENDKAPIPNIITPLGGDGKESGIGGSVITTQLTPGAAQYKVDLTFETASIADGLLIEYLDPIGNWVKLSTTLPVATNGEPININVTIPKGAQAVRISVNSPDGSVWNYKGTIESKNEKDFVYNDPWVDNWSNDLKQDYLAVDREPSKTDANTSTVGACSHQNSSTSSTPVTGAATQNLNCP